MLFNETNQLVSLVGAFGLGAAISAIIVLYSLKSYIPSYLSKKAENLATREDIAVITHEIEKVRTQYSVQLEELKVRQQVLLEEVKAKHQTKHLLRMAAIDRRLQAHQEAYVLWRGLYNDELGESVLKCQKWLDSNCLYLEPKVRQAFLVAFSAAGIQGQLRSAGADASLLMENWGKVWNFAPALFEAIQLPPLSEEEVKSLTTEVLGADSRN